MRKINWKIYAFSFIITTMIFALGFSIGLIIEKERLQEVEKINTEQNVQMKSLQLQQIYLEQGNTNCDAMKDLFEFNLEELTESMNRVIDYNNKALIDEEVFKYQLRDYFLTEIQFLLFSQELEDSCMMDSVTVIYFYNENERDVQGSVLDYLKNIFGQSMLVFSFDVNFEDEPMIGVLMKTYDVDVFPTVVINGEKFEGGVGSEELQEFICEELQDKPINCLMGGVF